MGARLGERKSFSTSGPSRFASRLGRTGHISACPGVFGVAESTPPSARMTLESSCSTVAALGCQKAEECTPLENIEFLENVDNQHINDHVDREVVANVGSSNYRRQPQNKDSEYIV
jgi:hypothetical protein